MLSMFSQILVPTISKGCSRCESTHPGSTCLLPATATRNFSKSPLSSTAHCKDSYPNISYASRVFQNRRMKQRSRESSNCLLCAKCAAESAGLSKDRSRIASYGSLRRLQTPTMFRSSVSTAREVRNIISCIISGSSLQLQHLP